MTEMYVNVAENSRSQEFLFNGSHAYKPQPIIFNYLSVNSCELQQ